MNILVLGNSGQVASELAKLEGVTALGRKSVDLLDVEAALDAITKLRPDAMINAAAYTAVDDAETHEADAEALNVTAPAALAKIAAAQNIPFVHISTDYVFDGSGTMPWRPDDKVAPLGVYGRTKAVGEDCVRNAGGSYVILRTSWVFSATGTNFVKTMLRLGAERDALNIVGDQIGGPTPAADIAKACVQIAHQLAEGARAGTYHFSGTPEVSWADFARTIFELSGLNCSVSDIPSSAYPTLAARPLNSRLDCGSTQRVFGISRPDWRIGLKAALNELGGQ